MLISYLICSHRAPPELQATLESVIRTVGSKEAEIVLVNNGFPVERERAFAEMFQTGVRGCIVREARPGLGYARLRAFSSASGEVLVLLDDDNLLGSDFDDRLRRVFAEHPSCGCVCPAVMPRWQVVPDRWLQWLGRECLSYNFLATPEARHPDREWLAADSAGAPRPPGGGMILHRDVVQVYQAMITGTDRAALGRTGTNLGGCEDADLFRGVSATGKTTVLSTDLHVFHQIPVGRCEFGYLLRLNFAMAQSYVELDRLRGVSTPRRWARHGLRQPGIELARGFGEAIRFAALPPLMLRTARALGAIRGLLRGLRLSPLPPQTRPSGHA